MKEILKTILKSLPRSVNWAVNSFIVAPATILSFMLLYSADFDLHTAGTLLLQVSKDDAIRLWNMTGWTCFILLIGFDFIKRFSMKPKQGEYFQMPTVAQLTAGTENDFNADIKLAHGIMFDVNERYFFKDLITQDEANKLLHLFKKEQRQTA